MLALRLVPLVSQVADSAVSKQALFLFGFMVVLPTRGASAASATGPSWLFWSCSSAVLWSDSPFLVVPAIRHPGVAVFVFAISATFSLPGLAPIRLFPLAGSATCLLASAEGELAACLVTAIFPVLVDLVVLIALAAVYFVIILFEALVVLVALSLSGVLGLLRWVLPLSVVLSWAPALYFPAFLVIVLFEVLVVLVALSLSGALGPRRGVLPLLLAVLVYNLPGGYLFLPGCAPLRCAGGPFAMHFRMREEFLISVLVGRRL